jgi:hypothetical protein
LTSLVKKIESRLDAVTNKGPRPPGVYVLHDSNVNGLDNQLRAMAANEGLKNVSLCIGGPPRDYEVSGEAYLTVVIYNVARRGQQNVQANFALRKGELDDDKIDAIVAALCQVLPD